MIRVGSYQTLMEVVRKDEDESYLVLCEGTGVLCSCYFQEHRAGRFSNHSCFLEMQALDKVLFSQHDLVLFPFFLFRMSAH